MAIEKDKLFIGVTNLFQAIFRLEFKTAKPILVLYDFKVEIESLQDEFLNHGKELEADEMKKMSKTKQKTREAKRGEIAKISHKMAQMAFEDLNLNPNGTLKADENNDPIKVESVSGKAFKFGLVCLIKKVTKMQLLLNSLQLKGMKSVSEV